MATIRKRENGVYQVFVRRKGYPQQSRTFDRHEDAKDWGREVEVEMRRGEFKDRRNAANTTLQQVLEYYRDNRVDENKGKEVDLIRIAVLLDSNLAKYSMSALTPDIIENWCNQRIKTHKVKGSTINRYLNLLSAAINVGIKKLRLGIDNQVKLTERKPTPQHRDRRIFGEEERRLLAALTSTEREGGRFTGPQNVWLKPLFEFALETAMRRSELLGLEWQYVDKARGVAHIPDTKIGKGDEAPVSRDVPLSAKAQEILKALPRDIGGKVFATTEDAVKKGFSRAVVRARKTYEAYCKKEKETPLARMLTDLRFHDTRHEATSRLAKIYDIKQLALVGGWRDLNTLAKYYNPTVDELVDKLRRHEATTATAASM